MVTREDVSGKTVKRIKVENNPLSELNINPWLEQKSVLSVPDGFSSDNSDWVTQLTYSPIRILSRSN